MENSNCRRDHTYCRSPEDKSENGFIWEQNCSKFINTCLNGSESPICIKQENGDHDYHEENENPRTVDIERLRLASAEANLQLERFYQHDHENIFNEITFLRCPKPQNLVSDIAHVSRSCISAPTQIPSDPKRSAFVPWKRTRSVTEELINTEESQSEESDRDEVTVFGEYVACQVKSIKGKYHRALMMKKIHDAIFDVKMMWLNECDRGEPDSSS